MSMNEMLMIEEVAPQQQYEEAAAQAFAEPDAQESAQQSALGTRLLSEFAQAEGDRRLTEERWLRDLRQYRGVYDPDVLAKMGVNRSKAFVRKTRVKVKTIDSRVADLLFPAGTEKNWDVKPTPKPSISKEQRAIIIKQLKAMQMQQAQAGGQPVPLNDDAITKAIEGFAKESSKKMAKTIEDQLVESRYKEVCIKAVHSGHLYGTGIIKGPLIERKVRTRFVMEGGKWVAKSESYVVPFVDYVPLWRFYPDMNATQLSECRYVYERHNMTVSDLAALAERKSFKKKAIVEYIKSHPQGQTTPRYIDNELKVIGERQQNQGQHGRGMYEVLERWGWLTGQDLLDVGVKVPTDRVHEAFFSNVWMLPNGEVIKAVLQPINGVTWPYHIYSFDKDETSIFCEGLAAVMRDDQTMLNAAVRLMLDNGALTSGPMVEVTPQLLSSYDKIDELAPWKVWTRNLTNPGTPAIRAIELPSHLNELQAMAAMFEQNTDEVTAIPRYMSGENATQGAAGTAAGMSMLMGAANIVIKDLITSWDEGITRPFLQALYRWNMQFNPDNSIKGDFDVQARGAASLVAKEVRGRLLNEFGQMTANPLDAPFIKRDVFNRLRAEALEMSDVVKSDDDVAAEQNNGPMQQQQQMAMQLQQLDIAMKQAQVAEIQMKAERSKAEAARIQADEILQRAKTISERVSAAYAALQAGGVVAASPHAAEPGDEILRSSGCEDATPEQSITQTMAGAQPGPAFDAPPMQPATGFAGEHAGIETEAFA